MIWTRPFRACKIVVHCNWVLKHSHAFSEIWCLEMIMTQKAVKMTDRTLLVVTRANWKSISSFTARRIWWLAGSVWYMMSSSSRKFMVVFRYECMWCVCVVSCLKNRKTRLIVQDCRWTKTPDYLKSWSHYLVRWPARLFHDAETVIVGDSVDSRIQLMTIVPLWTMQQWHSWV